MTIMIPAWVEGTLIPVEKLEAHQRGLKQAVSKAPMRPSGNPPCAAAIMLSPTWCSRGYAATAR